MSTLIARKSITINAPAEVIWDYIADVNKWTICDPTVKSAQMVGETKLGAKGKLVPTNGPSVIFTITKLEPLKTLMFTSPLLWTTLDFDHILTETNGEIDITFDLQCRGFLAGLVATIFRSMFASSLDTVLPRLKEVSEK